MQNVLIKCHWYFVENPFGDKGFFNENFGFVPNSSESKDDNYYSELIIKEISNFLLNN